MPSNRSLWQDEPDPIELEDRKLLIKVHAWAMNPCDAILQDKSLPFIKNPAILGQDIAGTVEAVGSTAATKFKVGDSGFGFPLNNDLQDCVVLDHTVTAKIPGSISYRDASVFLLCILTSCFALFGKAYLALSFSTVNSATVSNGKSLLIWRGSWAADSNSIQIAKASSKSLGADKVFDYSNPTVVTDMAAGKIAEACQVSYESKKTLFVASPSPIMPGDARGCRGEDYILPFGGFLTVALAKGWYKVAPPPEVVSVKGIQGIQRALDIFKRGFRSKSLSLKLPYLPNKELAISASPWKEMDTPRICHDAACGIQHMPLQYRMTIDD
ncbi:chaperonin 10-like protein [Pseudomassariella vexata]|uniref:Chaperonin 10-like protein n=1 Tax=Pseudomassariella vexata TaxID=1141098 RepID=A0A1Y2EA14_9PEZI|nr:chaperonin 10-like protein [Pseudomassariella vexata]ORY68411.1 chaperonin 10-like protein [Pseudomassariella vexata]